MDVIFLDDSYIIIRFTYFHNVILAMILFF